MTAELKFEEIKEEKLEQHEKMLKRQLGLIQLEYAEDVFANKQKELGRKISFGEVVGKSTALFSDLIKNFEVRYAKPDQKLDYEKLLGLHIKEIDKIYFTQGKDWQTQVFDYLQKEAEKSQENIVTRQSSSKNRRVGIIDYDLREMPKDDELTKIGLKEAEQYIELHLPEAYKRKNDISYDRKNLEISLSGLAEQIAEKYPHIKAIVGHSWLMSTPIAKKIGFETISEDESLGHISTWWQFIDKNGQINKQRIEKLKATGRVPYKVARAVIPVEKFLDKYLPEGKKGQVQLRDIDVAKEKMLWKTINDFFKKIEAKFQDLDEDQIKEYILQDKEISEIRDNEEGKKIFNYLAEMLPKAKKQNLNWEQIREKYKEGLIPSAQGLEDIIIKKSLK